MAIDFSAEIQGLTTLILGGKTLVKFTRDFTTVFQRIANDFRVIEKKNFNSQGTPEAFKELTKKYAAFKARKVGSRPIMVFSGRLRRSLTKRTADTIERISPREMTLGSRVPYAHRHQIGFKMPKRQVIQITAVHKRRWFVFFEKFLRFQIENRVFPKKGVL